MEQSALTDEKALPLLPPKVDVETKAVLKKCASAHRALAELKGKSATIPNQSILINTLALQEAKDSSAIENIITTHDELYKAQLFAEFAPLAAKEVSRYADALKTGFEQIRTQKVLRESDLLRIHQILEQNDAGYRKQPGTKLINDATSEIIYTPPQRHSDIVALMRNLMDYFNDRSDTPDPLVKMALIHFQFESIHPFYDGNGRAGRILNILYLVLHNLLDIPILYLSRYIIRTKSDYYRLLQETRLSGNYEPWILYLLHGVEETSLETIMLIHQIRALMQDYKHRIRTELPKLYSQDLLNNLFRHPYTKIEFLMEELLVKRMTATRYLEALVQKGFLQKRKIGRSNFYINTPLYALFEGARPQAQSKNP